MHLAMQTWPAQLLPGGVNLAALVSCQTGMMVTYHVPWHSCSLWCPVGYMQSSASK